MGADTESRARASAAADGAETVPSLVCACGIDEADEGIEEETGDEAGSDPDEEEEEEVDDDEDEDVEEVEDEDVEEVVGPVGVWACAADGEVEGTDIVEA